MAREGALKLELAGICRESSRLNQRRIGFRAFGGWHIPVELSNAFQQDGEGDDAPYRRKALQLNFYRPGDAIDQTEDVIRFGVPAFENEQEQAYILKQYGLQERLDYQWLFR